MTDTPPPPPDTPPPLIMGRSGLVELNIGGKPYTTTRQTLENSGFLRALTSGSFAAPRDAQGRIFVDRDATPAFDTMLTFLRGALGRTALDRMDLTTRAELVAEAEFYDVPALIGCGTPTGRRARAVLATYTSASRCPRRLRRAPGQAHFVCWACCCL